jgi:uncharacterized protein (TIGR02217 family)
MSADFEEVRLEANLIIYGAVGGPRFSTDVIVVRSGREKRNVNWSHSRGRWELGEREIDTAELHSVGGFFRARQGRAQGFRWKDWADYQATNTPLTRNGVTTQGQLGDGTGGEGTAYQLNKIYTSGATTTTRKITKPVSGTIQVYKNGILQSSGYTLDTITGVVTFTVAPGGADTLLWAGQFDTPVRFDTDEFRSRFDVVRTSDGEAIHWLMSLPIVEMRPV